MIAAERGRRIAALAVPALFAAVWAVYAGKDLNWDLLHYHYYVAGALAEGRLGQDYFAASAQSYLNPVAYLPFYLMVKAGWHSVAVSVLLAIAHAANITLLYGIARRLLAHRAAADREILAALGAALGAASAVFWAMVGTSFADVVLTIPMLAAVLLLVDSDPGKSVSRAARAGLLFGAAASLKYSNAFFALAGLALVAPRVRPYAAYAAGGLAAAALLAGPWMTFLYREFGNPFFPHLNAWFGSPDFLPINLTASRYVPQDLAQALAFPFRMALPESLTYAEISAPDIRFAAIAVLAAAVAVSRLLRTPEAKLGAADARFLAFFLLSLSFWIATSANGRYGLLVLLLAGPCAARLAERALAARAARGALLVLIAAQSAACAMISPARWFVAERWSRQWLPFEVPERARRQPALYLTVETQSMAAVAPFLHPRSSFVNLRGQKGGTPGWKRIVEPRLARGPVRALGRGLRPGRDGRPLAEVIEGYASTLARFGLRVDPSDCFEIAWHDLDDDPVSRAANALSGNLPSRAKMLSLASCGLVPAAREPGEAAAEARVSAAFDRVERACPRLFRGQTAVTDRYGAEWSRTYTGLDARLETHSGRVVLAPFFRLVYYDLGNLLDWERGDAPLPPSCRS